MDKAKLSIKMDRDLYLAIETSCDETSLAILAKKTSLETVSFYDFVNSFEVIASVISSQISTHAKYGGVVPEIGARQHADQIHFLLQSLLDQIGDEDINILTQIKSIFVTTEPGLISALRVGVEFAKTLKFYLDKSRLDGQKVEIVNVNHLRGHMISTFFEPEKRLQILDYDIFPHIHLLVSGGNSQIILMNSWKDWQIIGQTLDDAAGECLDKVGRMVGLPYPGGVYLAKIAKLSTSNPCNFPVGMKKNESLNYSFSGLKTAVRYFLQDSKVIGFRFEAPLEKSEINQLQEIEFTSPKLELIHQVCISAQAVVVAQLMNKTESAIAKYKPSSIGLSGGVSANLLLRSRFDHLKEKFGLAHMFYPDLKLSGDNAVMIGLAGILTQKYT
jgi:N6-L-threonylcarbamoyladenine synthase